MTKKIRNLRGYELISVLLVSGLVWGVSALAEEQKPDFVCKKVLQERVNPKAEMEVVDVDLKFLREKDPDGIDLLSWKGSYTEKKNGSYGYGLSGYLPGQKGKYDHGAANESESEIQIERESQSGDLAGTKHTVESAVLDKETMVLSIESKNYYERIVNTPWRITYSVKIQCEKPN